MTIIAHHRGRVYSDRQNTCYICEKVINTDKDDWEREKDTIWHDRCGLLQDVKETKEEDMILCDLCEKPIGYGDCDLRIFCLECKQKYK